MTVRKATSGSEAPAEPTHVGFVLRVRDASDSLSETYSTVADVWDPETSSVKAVVVGGGWWGQSHNGSAEADASDEVRAAAYATEYARVLPYEVSKHFGQALSEAESCVYHRNAVRKGSTAKVVKGRKVPVGTEGVVIWTGSGQYGERVGLKDADGTVHWTAASNVEATGDLVEVWDFLPDPATVLANAEHDARQTAAYNSGSPTSYLQEAA